MSDKKEENDAFLKTFFTGLFLAPVTTTLLLGPILVSKLVSGEFNE
jgi:hypothetical protein